MNFESLKNKMLKYVKYLLIAILNLVLLTVLLVCWTDDLELIFNDYVRPVEFLKILGFTFLSLLGMWILVLILKKKSKATLRIKLVLAILLTFLISSYLYVDYSVRFIDNIVIHGSLRSGITDKIEPTSGLAYGSKADSLTIREYQEIAAISGFPEVPVTAINIAYDYKYDGFLPDYSFKLEYDAPDTVRYKYGAEYQPFMHVTHTEYAD